LLNHSLSKLTNTDNVKTISENILYASFFYHYVAMLLESTNMSKHKAVELAKEILYYVFGVDKDYRVYKNTETFNYKGFMLTRYIQ